jgi:hypothetical protein
MDASAAHKEDKRSGVSSRPVITLKKEHGFVQVE